MIPLSKIILPTIDRNLNFTYRNQEIRISGVFYYSKSDEKKKLDLR